MIVVMIVVIVVVVVVLVLVVMVMRWRVVALPCPANPDLSVFLPGAASTSTSTGTSTSTSTSTRAATTATAAGAAVIVPGASRRAVARALEPVARVIAFAFLELERTLLHSQSVPVARALADVERGDRTPAVAERLAIFPVARRAGAHRRRGGV
jgi:hypothetical protein